MNYQTVVRALSLVSGDLSDIATQTQERITLAQAEAAHQHLNSILWQLIPRSASVNVPRGNEYET